MANHQDQDFIEIDYSANKLTYNDLIETCSKELGVEKADIASVRKWPDTKIRLDEDVQRFNRLEHVEVSIVPFMRQEKYPYQK